MEDGSVLSDNAVSKPAFAGGRVTGPAFQGACQPSHVTTLQFVQLQDNMESRFDELVKICREGNTCSETPLLKALQRNTDVTASELFQLKQHMHRLEALLYRCINTEGERLCVKGPQQETGSILQLEARLEAHQGQLSAQFEEVKRICSEACRSSQQLEERLSDIEMSFAGASLERKSRAGGNPIQMTHTESAGSLRTLGSDVRERQLAKVASCSKDVSYLCQVLGWSRDEEGDDEVKIFPDTPSTLTVDHDPVASCRAYMEFVSTFLITLNTAYLGVALHFSMSLRWQGHERPPWIAYGDLAFLIAFILELIARMALDKLQFFLGQHFLWNAIDVLTTVILFLEVAIDIGNASFLRTLRLVRIAGSLRVLLAARKMRMLRILLRSLPRVIEPMICTSGFLLFILYLSSLGLTQFVQIHVDHHPEAAAVDCNLRDLYGSIWATMFTLLVAIMGNGDWHQLVEPLSAISAFLVPVFVLIAFFSVAGVSNLLIAVQVDRVIRDSQVEDRQITRESLATKQSSINELRQLLVTTEGCTRGVLLRKYAARALRGPGLVHLQNMGLELQVSLGLLRMLDKECMGIVNLEEFLCGLSQLLAENVSVHMATTMYECRRLGHQIQMVHNLIENLHETQLLNQSTTL